MNIKSLWLEGIEFSPSDKLNKDIDVDVLIIGGGITGLNTAYQLINSNKKVALVERGLIGHGVTSRTTGKITFLQENIYSKLNSYHNKEKSKLYLNSQLDAINIITNIIEENKIKCDLYKVKSFLFANNDKEVKKVKKEEQLLKEFNIKTKSYLNSPNNSLYSISVDNTYVFHPLKYLNYIKNICIKNNISIYENTKIVSINKKDDYYECMANNKKIKAKYVVLALHYPYFLLPFMMPLKVTLEKSYLSVSKVDKFLDFSAINVSKPTISIRYHKDENDIFKIKLTGSHNLAFKNNEKENFAKLKLINKDISYEWSNMDIMTNDYLPYIGEISKNLLIGTGYNTWGMTNSTIAGKIISDIILEKENKYIDLFNPKRGLNKAKIVNFPLSIFSNMKAFLGSKINKDKSWYSTNIKFINKDGENLAIYIDENKKEHIVYNRCPHLKCSLIFNEIEKTWDCPCHGSRFDIDGNLLEGPSNYDIRYKKL